MPYDSKLKFYHPLIQYIFKFSSNSFSNFFKNIFVKILIIEDERELSDTIAAYLKDENYVCEVAFDFYEALKKIEQSVYECILLDITLPGGSGF